MPETVLVIDDSLLMRGIARDYLEKAGFAVRLASSGLEGLALLAESLPDLILCDVVMPEMDGYAFCRRVRELSVGQAVPIVLMTGQIGLGEKVAGFEAGASEFLTKPFEAEELLAKLLPLLGREVKPARRSGKTAVPNRAGGPGQTITCFSLKGGVGTSVIATNLAVSLAQLWTTPVALLDLHLEQGSTGLLLDLAPRRTLQHLADWHTGAPDEPAPMSDFLIEHSSGVRLLAAPEEPQHAELVTADVVSAALIQLRSSHRFVVVDAGSSFQATTLSAFDSSDLFVLPLTPDLASLKALRATIGVLEAIGIPEETFRLVMNYTQAQSSLSQRDVDRTLGRQVDARIPFGDRMTELVNRGRPVVLEDPESPAGAALIMLAYRLSEAVAPANAPASPLLTRVRRALRNPK